MITNRAMLAAVHISVWTATKHDRRVSRAVADQKGARERAGRYNKQLLMGAEKLEELRNSWYVVSRRKFATDIQVSSDGYSERHAHPITTA